MTKEPFFKIIFRKSAAKTDAAWEDYTNAYGDWMANAFLNQKKEKEQFLQALDSLHKNLPKSAVQILDSELKALCKTAEEKTTWLFFMGIAHEAMEQYAKAFLYFIAATEYEPESFIIQQKLADCAYREGLFGFAEYHYLEAIRLLKDESSPDYPILYASLASCFIMMHKYEEAEKALLSAEKTGSQTLEEEQARILLYVVRGEYEKADALFLNNKNIQEDRFFRQQIDAIRSGTDEQFCTIDVENSEIKAFWRWFSTHLDHYLSILDADQSDEISQMTSEISERLKKVFPFFQRKLNVSAYKNQNYTFFVSDFYAQALSDGLKNLLASMPEKVKERVHWVIIH